MKRPTILPSRRPRNGGLAGRHAGDPCARQGDPDFTYDEEIAYLKQYITQRIDWLNTQWGPDEQYSNRLYDNTLIDRITADELIYSIGEVDSSGYLSWNYQPEVFPNSPLSSFWGYSYDSWKRAITTLS